MRIYQIPSELREIEEALELTSGELTPEIEQRLDEFKKSSAQSFTYMANLIDEYDTAEQKLKERAKELTEMAKQKSATRARLSQYVLDTLTEMGQKKLQFDTVTIRRQNNPEGIEVVDEAVVPNKYKVVDCRLRKTIHDEMVQMYGMETDKEEPSVRKKELHDHLKKYRSELKEQGIAPEEIDTLVNARATELGVALKQTERLVIKGV